MSANHLNVLLRRSKTRVTLAAFAVSLPLLLALATLLPRFASVQWTAAGAVLGAIAVTVAVLRVRSAIDLRGIIRRLDGAAPSLDDSSDLLGLDEASLSPLQVLQRARVLDRLTNRTDIDLRPRWPWRSISASVTLAVIALAFAVPRPSSTAAVVEAQSAPPPAPAVAGISKLVSARIDVEAPRYTNITARSETALDLDAPEGSALRWQLRFDTTPGHVALQLHDGARVALVREGDDWVGRHTLVASTLYRIELGEAAPLEDDSLHRLNALPDAAPEIRVIEPERTLTLLEGQPATWPLVFEASDDYGIASARLSITLAQGSGEQITVKQQEVALRADPGQDLRHRRYRHAVDLASLGFARGDDVIVRVIVSDTRQPQANLARSASFILRWPPELSAEAEGVDGIVQKTLPAYFRSQRQIIIDSEALLVEKATLPAATFVNRSDAIGVDQKILRLRYGQFLGEEFESGGGPKPEKPAVADQRKADRDDNKKETAALPEGHALEDGHDHAPAAFGNAGDVVAEYGHAHDHAEAATLLDPETKRILKAALSEMWQAELQLRLGDPKQALPFENRALDYIKQVQQSTRIYLARVGLELPPVDEKRRLSGDRASLRNRRVALAEATSPAAAVAEFHRALVAGAQPDVTALQHWLDEHRAGVPDALNVIAALDAWRRDEACAACRDRLLDALWPLLPTPAAATPLRKRPDALGDAYLDALRTLESK